jgi:hypothetical protein
VSLGRVFDAERLRRNFYANSSCGVCGKAALEDVEVRCSPVGPGPEVPLDVLLSLPQRLRAGQKMFDRTGGLHAAGLFGPPRARRSPSTRTSDATTQSTRSSASVTWRERFRSAIGSSR